MDPNAAFVEQSAPVRPPGPTARSRRLAWLAVALIVLGAGLIRIRLLDLPLERDEGEYAYAGQLMLHGIVPYKLAWNMKFPGTYAAYALIMMVLGQTIRAIHLGLTVVNAATTVLLFMLARRLFDVRAAVAACGTFAFLSMGPSVLGMAGHATHFVVAFAVAGTLLLFEAIESGSSLRLWASGLLFGLAILMKQQGVFLAMFGGVWLLWSLARARTAPALALRRLMAFTSGAVLPLALTFLTLWKLGVFEKFWFWTWQYAREYASELTLSEGFLIFRHAAPKVVTPNAAIWALAGAGLILIWWKSERMRIALPVTLFFLFSFLAVCPGFYFREHYFILMLPAVSLLAGAAVDATLSMVPGSAALWVWGTSIAFSAFVQSGFLFMMSPIEASRAQYGMNPFPEAIEVARYIRSVTAPGSRIAVLGSEPEIYFYADRLPATGYMYTYGMMEPQPFAAEMQDEMIRELEENKPEYIVVATVSTSWLPRPNSSTHIFDWWKAYGGRNYAPADFVIDSDPLDRVRPGLLVMRRKAGMGQQ